MAAVFVLLAAGCGDGGERKPSSITVIARDLSLEPKELTAKEGRIEIRYQDEGQLAHHLLIDGIGDFMLAVDGEGDEDRGVLALETGTYMLYCDLPGHRAAGMEATLSVS
jgi:plastocyanin